MEIMYKPPKTIAAGFLSFVGVAIMILSFKVYHSCVTMNCWERKGQNCKNMSRFIARPK